jgi:hypothetical protein
MNKKVIIILFITPVNYGGVEAQVGSFGRRAYNCKKTTFLRSKTRLDLTDSLLP